MSLEWWSPTTGLGQLKSKFMLRDFRGDLERALPGSRAIQVPTHGHHGQHMGSETLGSGGWKWNMGALGSWRQGEMPEGLWNVTVFHNLHCSPDNSKMLWRALCPQQAVLWKAPARTCFAPDTSPSTGLLRGEAGQSLACSWYPPEKKTKNILIEKQIHNGKVNSRSWRINRTSPLL